MGEGAQIIESFFFGQNAFSFSFKKDGKLLEAFEESDMI